MLPRLSSRIRANWVKTEQRIQTLTWDRIRRLKRLKALTLVCAVVLAALFLKPHTTGIPVAYGALSPLTSPYQFTGSGPQVVPDSSGLTLTVASFNGGLLKFGPFQMVPCVDARLKAQIDYIFVNDRLGLGMADQGKAAPFVLLLQEIWTPEAFEAYRFHARDLGLTIIPSDYAQVADTGMVTISNMKSHGFELLPFAEDDPGAKRGILQSVFSLNQALISVANIHTSYHEKLGANPVQFAQIRGFMEEMTPGAFHIVGGDFNIGPEIISLPVSDDGSSAARSKPFWSEFIASTSQKSWERVSLDQPTWDQKNPIASEPALFVRLMSLMLDMGDWSGSEILDHIFVSGNFRISAKEISFNEKVFLDECEHSDPEGRAYLSDHYGVKAVLEL